VIVIGGGVAGLSGGTTLARAGRRVLVVDSGHPRNAPASGVHGFLTRGGIAPRELLAIGRAELAGYGGRLVEGTVTSARRIDGGFTVELADGTSAQGARLLVATGLTDELPEVSGLAERWGREVVHCPYCHGYEVRDDRLAVLGTGPMSVEQALLWRGWCEDVTLLLNDAVVPTGEQVEQLAARDVSVVEGKVDALVVEHDRLTGARLSGGTTVPIAALALATGLRARADVLADLGLRPVEAEMRGLVLGSRVDADPTGATAIPGVWVAGNVTSVLERSSPPQQVARWPRR